MSGRIHTIERHESGLTIVQWLQRRLHLSDKQARGRLAARQVRINGSPCSNPAWKLRAGQRVEVAGCIPEAGVARGQGWRGDGTSPTSKRNVPHSLADQPPPIVVRHADEAIVVVEKPAGLTTMRHADEAAEFGARGRKYLPPTLADFLPEVLARRRNGKRSAVRAVHRLDRDTTGLVVFACTPQAEADLGRQFREHSIERVYLAVVRGVAVSGRIESWLVRDRGDGRRGSGVEGEGQRAITNVEVVEPLGAFTLVRCRLETGRTHQVRIHLGEAGTPLCGERIYDRPLRGRPYPDGSGLTRPALHAATLGLTHPVTGKRMTWSADLPADLHDLLRRLRRLSKPSDDHAVQKTPSQESRDVVAPPAPEDTSS